MRQIFDLHPAAITGRLLAGYPDAGPAPHDAEPEPDTVHRGIRERLATRLALRRRREAAPAARPTSV